ncbi:MAG: DUF4384 domain-containing protein [Pseudomonadota bacterium]
MNQILKIVATTLLAFCATADAANRALIVGVGVNRDPRALDLIDYGVPEDVEMYTDIALMMGIPKSGIRVLRDEAATVEAIRSSIRDWLQRGVGPGDRAFFAYSGHGTKFEDISGDEVDGQDEALVPHDAIIKNRTGYNFLLDDDLRQLLTDVNTEDLTVFVDSCHSGTITRSVWNANPMGISEVRSRYWKMPPGTRSAGRGLSTRSAEQIEVPYLTFSAAQDDESSVGTSQGGVFTLSIYNQLKEMKATGEPRTPIQIMERAQADIRSWADGDKEAFEPNVSGPAQILSRPFRLDLGSGNQKGPLWQRLEELVDRSSGRLDLRLNQQDFQLGDQLNIATLLPSGGYLNVINVDAQDNATVLFPNRTNPRNRVNAGAITLPTPEMQFALIAAEPVGSNLIVALLSERPINLYESGFGERGEGFASQYRSLSISGLRAFTVTPTQGNTSTAGAGGGFLASKVITNVRY